MRPIALISLILLSICCKFSASWAQVLQCKDVFHSDYTPPHRPLTNSGFYFTPKNLTKKEELVLSQFKIERAGTYDKFGEVEGLGNEIKQFLFEKIGGSDEVANRIVASAIDRIVHDVLKNQNAAAAWVTIRATKPNGVFDLPRWHMDGSFFIPPRPTFKYAQVLKGPNTLLVEVPDSLRNELNAISMNRSLPELEGRKIIATLFEPYQIIQASPGQGLYFLVGDPLKAAIHSEPEMKDDRIFFSVVAGSVSEIADLAKRWGVQ